MMAGLMRPPTLKMSSCSNPVMYSIYDLLINIRCRVAKY